MMFFASGVRKITLESLSPLDSFAVVLRTGFMTTSFALSRRNTAATALEIFQLRLEFFDDFRVFEIEVCGLAGIGVEVVELPGSILPIY
jgi:hypothetical protein